MINNWLVNHEADCSMVGNRSPPTVPCIADDLPSMGGVIDMDLHMEMCSLCVCVWVWVGACVRAQAHANVHTHLHADRHVNKYADMRKDGLTNIE